MKGTHSLIQYRVSCLISRLSVYSFSKQLYINFYLNTALQDRSRCCCVFV